MALVEIKTPQDDPSFSLRTVLDGREFVVSFAWNQREERWYLSIADQDDSPIVNGVKLVADWPVNALCVDERGPYGFVYAIDTTGQGLDPGLNDLGRRHVVVYSEIADVMAVADGGAAVLGEGGFGE